MRGWNRGEQRDGSDWEFEDTVRPPTPATCAHWMVNIITVSYLLNGTMIYKINIMVYLRRLQTKD